MDLSAISDEALMVAIAEAVDEIRRASPGRARLTAIRGMITYLMELQERCIKHWSAAQVGKGGLTCKR
jgi:hypothetical protein